MKKFELTDEIIEEIDKSITEEDVLKITLADYRERVENQEKFIQELQKANKELYEELTKLRNLQAK